ncbi:MAG: tetratricopeptide repeat protein [Chitinophagaceae bacterium]|nr:tetratricopeptide repeat protein [Chitinophagaceae bacterium]
MTVSKEVMIERAKLLIEQNRYDDAERELKKVLATDPEHDEALSLMARIKIDSKKPYEAFTYLDKALSLCPTEDYYLYLKSFAHFQLDQVEEAERLLKDAIQFNPWHPGYFALYANILTQQRKYKEALDKANQGLSMNPSDINCLNARTQALVKLNRSGEAFESIKHTLAADPENDYSHTNAGFSFLEKGKHKQAAQHFTEALRINPANENARDGMKDALRSNIAPYRWLLQYEYWLQNKGRNMRVIFVIGLFLGVRYLAATASSVPKPLAIIFYTIFVLYILMALISWIIKPVANMFLSFHPKGKYAVTKEEKWISITVLGPIALGFMLLLPGILLKGSDENGIQWFTLGIITASLALPFNYIRYPLKSYTRHFRQWMGLITVSLGISVVLSGLLIRDAEINSLLLAIYGPVWFIGMWIAAFTR